MTLTPALKRSITPNKEELRFDELVLDDWDMLALLCEGVDDCRLNGVLWGGAYILQTR